MKNVLPWLGIIRLRKEENMQKNIQNITAVIEYIEAHLTEKLDLDTIADAVHLSLIHI